MKPGSVRADGDEVGEWSVGVVPNGHRDVRVVEGRENPPAHAGFRSEEPTRSRRVVPTFDVAEPSVALLEVDDRVEDIAAAEVGEKRRRHIYLGVCDLPE